MSEETPSPRRSRHGTDPSDLPDRTGSSLYVDPDRAPHAHRRSARRASGFGSALLLTIAGAVVPGTTFLATGRRKVGAVLLALFLLLVAGGVLLATYAQRDVVRLAVDSTALRWIIAGIVVLALGWLAVVVTGYLAVRPRRLRPWQRGVGTGVVALLCAAVVVPAAWGVQLATAQRDLVDSVFDDGDSATVTQPVDRSNAFGGQDEVNILLLGGDGGEGREGVRTDTVIVANVQVDTGATTLFSLPRNLEELPFPASSPLAAVYPDGFDAGSEAESLLNAVYRNGPAQHPDVLGPTDDAGADFLKLGVGEALGLKIDYYVLVNLDGFSRLVDALGGLRLNVNYYVPVNGDTATGALPDRYIAPGPDQLMGGVEALDFARGRYGLSDYLRMDRQRCVLQAIVDAADPVTLLSRYQELARTTQDIVSSDVPSDVLGDVVDLAFQVKEAGIRSVVFDDTVINPAYPDYARIRALVQEALRPVPTGGADTTTPAPVTSAAPAPATPSAPPAATPSPGGNGGVASEVTDACAYDPVQAAAALAAGEPPNRSR
ncbi:LCP family protein [Modestobacter sp. VKM Ac-2986]|uniref:LCP family protein n=1 Tax=Modestobacter sp. VKM Ac-2986 TaxID=3004140 RepID=UPI0022AA8B58|nr:LCP family protein [Modestobacter sp. VKM Ac-2986]MCZ2827507.1 LCP family protein [Modestobacter sp. VKM Ac-2986]